MDDVNLANKSSSAIVVRVAQDLEELIPGYLCNRENDIKTLSDKCAQGDFESIRLLGHSIKGSGGSYGFDRITAIGSEIEQAARVMSAEGISRGIAELEDYIRKVRVVYE